MGEDAPGSTSISISTAWYDLIRQVSAERELSAGASVHSVSAVRTAGADRWTLFAERSRYEFTSRNDPELLDVRADGEQTQLSAGFDHSFGGVAGGVGLSVAQSHGRLFRELSGSVAVSLPHPLVKGLRIGVREHNFPGEFRASYHDAVADFRYSVHGLSTEGAIELAAGEDLDLTAEREESVDLSAQPEDEFSFADSYRFTRSRVLGVWHSTPWVLKFLYDAMDSRDEPDMLYDGTTFGHANAADLTFRRGAIRGEFGDPRLGGTGEIGYAEFSGRITGNVESWPFLDILESIIANRLNYRASFRVTAAYADIGVGMNAGGVIFTPGVTFFDARPSVRVETWQPEFLVFGVRDYTESRVNVDRAVLAHLRLGMEFEGFGCRLKLAGGQLVPIMVERPEESAGSGGGDGGGGGEEAQARTDGGRWLMFTISKVFE